ncbi:hypothetical protein FJTKL_13592 [Diaporthe vaccinii]|uniref:Uncharacterized protein n=1 Tax=Diaporthe vaccinii TaxID=105482 RepID=A0ABR4E9V1_9PEZI
MSLAQMISRGTSTWPSNESLPVLLDNLNNNPMILMLLQPTNNNNSNHALDPLDPDGHRPAVDGISRRDLLAHAELGPERGLVAVVLAVLEPRAGPPPQHRVALPLHPDLVVGHHTGPRHGLEQHLPAVGERDRDDCCRRDWQQAPPEQVAQDPGVVEGEGLEREGVAVLLERLELCGVFSCDARRLGDDE